MNDALTCMDFSFCLFTVDEWNLSHENFSTSLRCYHANEAGNQLCNELFSLSLSFTRN